MEVKIQIDDGQLAKLVNEELGNIDKEVVHDIAVSALKQFFSDNHNIENILVNKGYDGWTLKPVIEEMLKDAVNNDDVREFTVKIMEVAKTKAEHLIKSVLFNIFMKNLFTDENRNNFMCELNQMIEQRQ